MQTLLFVTIAILLMQFTAVAQGPRAGEPPLPKMNVPPGYTTKVEKVTKSYNFWGLKREIPLPWDRIVMQPGEIPAGVKLVDAFSTPDKAATEFYNDPVSKIPAAGKPAKMLAQVFKGKKKKDDGTIIYMEWSNKLPANMREQLARLFYKKDLRPEGAQQVEFICSDNTLILWCFKDHESDVKQAHQDKIFNLVSEIANKMFPAPPAQPGAPSTVPR